MIVLLAASLFFYRLCPWVEPAGTDGFFYLKQIESISSSFSFYYHDYSFSFLLPSLLNIFLKNSLLCLNLSASLVWGVIAWVCLSPKTKREIPFALIGLGIFMANFLTIELTAVFYKTGFAVMCAVVMLRFLKNRRFWMAGIFAIVSILSHKSMLVILPILILPFCNISLKRNKLFFLGMGALGLLALIIYPRIFSQLLHVIQDGFFWEKFREKNLEKLNLISFVTLLGLGSLFSLLLKSKEKWSFLIILMIPLLAPGVLNAESLSFRFLIIGFPFLLLALREGIELGGKARVGALSLTVVTAALTWYFYRPLSTWSQNFHLRVTQAEQLNNLLPKDALIFAPHGVEFYLAYKTHFRPRSLRIEAEGRPVYRVAFIKPYLKQDSMLVQDLELMQILNMGEFGLFKEEDWVSLNSIYKFFPHPLNLLPKKPEFISEYKESFSKSN